MNASRFHVHIHVADLDANLRFYSQLFGAQPSVVKPDYAKWMLDDPRLNFAISSGKEGATGIAHLGVQVESPAALQAIGARLQSAGSLTLAEVDATCCYAKSDKFWARDPQGVQWESFHSRGEAISYYVDPSGVAVERDQCCGPAGDAVAGTAADRCAPVCGVAASEQVTPSGARACCG